MAPQIVHPRIRTLPGAFNVGKVTVVMKEKTHKSILPKLLGIVVYPLFFAALFLSFSWTRPLLRFSYTLPACKAVLQGLSTVKAYFSQAVYPLEVNANGFTIIDKHTTSATVQEQGYVHAMERMYQMEIYRRAALGTVSEIFGNQTIYLDRYARTLNFLRLAEDDFAALSPDTQVLLQSYAKGVNMYIERESTWTLPMDFGATLGAWSAVFSGVPRDHHNIYHLQPWKPEHSLAILRMILYERSRGWEDDVLAFVTGKIDQTTGGNVKQLFDLDASTTLDKLSIDSTIRVLPGLGGLVVAIGAERSASGKSILAHNYFSASQHQGFLYRNCLYSPTLATCGLSFPGVPLALVGRNRQMSWAIVGDTLDTAEQLFHAPANAVLGHATQRNERIEIHKSAETLVVTVTTYGDDVEIQGLLSTSLQRGADIGKVILRSAFLTERLDPSLFLRLASASSPVDISPLLLAGLPFRVVYASADGAVGTHCDEPVPVTGDAPARATAIPRMMLKKTAVDGKLAADGVVIAGSPELLTAADELMDKDACFSFNLCSLLRDVHGGKKVSEDKVLDVLRDTFSPSGQRFAGILQKHFFSSSFVQQLPDNVFVDEGRAGAVAMFKKQLSRFDGRYDSRSIVPTMVEGVRAHVLNAIFGMQVAADERRLHDWSTAAVFNGYYAGLVGGQNLTALTRMSVLSHRTRGVDTLLAHADSSLALAFLLNNATKHTLNWLQENFAENVFHPNVAEEGAAWQWGQVHARHYAHMLESVGKFLDAVMVVGPLEGAGAMDSADVASHQGAFVGSFLLDRQDLHGRQHDLATAATVVTTMGSDPENIYAQGPGLASRHSSHPSAWYTPFQRSFWEAMGRVLDITTGAYHKARGRSEL